MKKRICAFLALLILLSVLPMETFAESSIDPDSIGSITVRAIYKKVALEGMKLNCVRVGKLVYAEDEFVYECLFNKDYVYTEKNIHSPNNPGDMLKLVNEASVTPITRSADKYGRVKFDNLKPGLYLIYQTEKHIQTGKRFDISAFLVTVPYDGEMDVNAECKPGLDMYPEQPTQCPPTYTQKLPQRLPQTGQLNWPIPVLAACGMLLFAIGWWLCFGNRKDSYEK